MILQVDTISSAVATTSSDDSGSALLGFLFVLAIAATIGYFVSKRKKKRNTQQAEAILQTIDIKNQIKDEYEFAPYFRVKGISFTGPLKTGWYVCQLRAISNNKYDKYAIEIIHNVSGHLGWIPKGNQHLHALISSGKEVFGALEVGEWEEGQYGKLHLDVSDFTKEDIGMFIDFNKR